VSPRFSHLDPGTAEELWRDELGRRSVGPVDDSFDFLIVVAAHPDDETLGAAGLMARAATRGVPVVVVVASDGERSHPGSPTHTPEQLAALRRHETTRAVSMVAPGSGIRFLGIPDGELDAHTAALRAAIAGVVDGSGVTVAERVLLVAPWSGDGHRDHRVVAEACAEVRAARGIRHLGYPIWAWHWGNGDDLPWAAARMLRLDDDETSRKRRAIACHSTQIEPLSSQPGDEVLIHAEMRSHFEREVEIFLLEEESTNPAASLDGAWFDAFYERNGEDPWGFESRWYEERKRRILLGSLPQERLGAVLEVGCATGVLTAQLASRSRSVVAMDAAEAAVTRARERLRAEPHVTVIRAAAPDDWPTGEFDTIVVSEVGYYLTAADLRRFIDRAAASLSADGCVVACHWRHPVSDYPLTGDDVHGILHEHSGWEALVTHRERDFVLEVFAPQGARSVADREGLT
jgi:LmbE family N-acetylglucosaminyl deacetylase/SAM-dependent methyltransferase